MPNLLADEHSLYLRQHADNPVEWRPWGPEAFEVAARLDRPVFISIGYSSCHWCHVMAHESFEDQEVADLLNTHFVSIKIDREEFPAIDAQYMMAVMLLQGQGGWPMSVFALSDGRPFFGGTYYPKTSRGGHLGFIELLQKIKTIWRDEREKIVDDAQRLSEGVMARSVVPAAVEVETEGIHAAAGLSLQDLDPEHGGYLGAPKFPPHSALRLWLHLADTYPEDEQLEAVIRLTLDRLCWSGFRDQLGGAFHRYCVDDQWRVPHFEQMLYDNAQLLDIIAGACLRYGDNADKHVLSQLLVDIRERWVTNENWFAAAWDADDPGGEGAYYTWTVEEVEKALLDDAATAISMFHIEKNGPVDGRSTLHLTAPPGRLADQPDDDEIWAKYKHAVLVLSQARQNRAQPVRDDKGIVSENGMMLAALARASRVVGGKELAHFNDVANRLAELSTTELPRAWYTGSSRGTASLEDYAGLGLGLLSWGLATDQPLFLEHAVRLARLTVERFNPGSWSIDNTELPLGAPVGTQDSQQMSAFSLTLDWLTDLYAVTGDPEWQEEIDSLIHHCSGAMSQSPQATKDLWRAVDRSYTLPQTVFLSGDGTADWYDRLCSRSGAGTLWIRPECHRWLAELSFPAALDKPSGFAYVCSGAVCQAPMAYLSDLADALTGPVH